MVVGVLAMQLLEHIADHKPTDTSFLYEYMRVVLWPIWWALFFIAFVTVCIQVMLRGLEGEEHHDDRE